MTVYVVTENGIETGTFRTLRNETVQYQTKNDGIKWEHVRNVFFSEKNAQYQYLRTLGITRPILNGMS